MLTIDDRAYARKHCRNAVDGKLNFLYIDGFFLCHYNSDDQPVCRGTLVYRFLSEKYHRPCSVCGSRHDLLTTCAAAQKRLATTALKSIN